ncbi:MAG: (d)CMP kinase [Magnetococcales bacterium]|nr:(d)CMP kinase [Magnetococcales bacterium]
MHRDRLIVAVDGPAGAGKGSVCRAVAQHFDMAYLDTGAIYRALALTASRHGLEQPEQLAQCAASLPFAFVLTDAATACYTAFLDGEDVTRSLRDESVGQLASSLSAIPAIRTALLGFQRSYGGGQDTVLDGRDVGTVVFPEAQLKIFLTADLASRAKRRALELQSRGEHVILDEIQRCMAGRDARDAARSHAPLAIAVDAVVIDTTCLTLEQSTTRVMGEVERILAIRDGGDPST